MIDLGISKCSISAPCPEVYPEPSQTSKMEILVKIVNGFPPFTIFAKSSILDLFLSSECVSTAL